MFQSIGGPAYKANLQITITFDNYFKHPHKNFKTIHIAGTNGKGSVSNLIASILFEAGYKVGLYTSPHLKDFRERIKINGNLIPESEVANFITNNLTIIENLKPTFFEVTTALAFCYFKEQKVDIAVIETGLGGRLDCTNIINPLLSVITNISFDHADLLGNTLEKIAFEKAGIIKKDTPIIVGETQDNLKNIFVKKAKEQNSKIYFADKIYNVKKSYITNNKFQNFSVFYNDNKVYKGLQTTLLGKYQKKNTQTVLTCIKILLQKGIEIDSENIFNGFKNVTNNTHFIGRWQILSEKPFTICDIGHNEAGIKENMSQLLKLKHNNLHIVFGMVADKDSKKILKHLPKKAIYYFTKAKISRAKNEKELFAEATNFGLNGNCFDTVKDAYNSAKSKATSTDIIYIGGSTFIVADFYNFFYHLFCNSK